MKRFYRLISLPLEIVLVLAAVFAGWKMIEPHLAASQFVNEGRAGSQVSFPSIRLLIMFILSVLIHLLIQLFGSLGGGLLGGRKLTAIRLGRTNYIRENGQFYKRETLVEQELLPIIMVREEEKSFLSWFFYLYGNVLLDILITFICFFLISSHVFYPSTVTGTFLLGFWFSGIITVILSAFPLYRAGIPNNALILFYTLVNQNDRTALTNTFRFLYTVSEGQMPDMGDFREVKEETDSFLTGYDLYHRYESAIWQGDFEKARVYMSALFEHRHEYPEEFEDLIGQEVICALALNGSEEDLSVCDLYVSEFRKKRLETSLAASSSRCLYHWSLHHEEMDEQTEYYKKQYIRRIKNIPFELVRESWMGTIIHG
ncbi:MAG: hypothetical protein IJM83_10060 [Firmicutes bacterium]|nr:hypothetical protein [Bacillota bacterium]